MSGHSKWATTKHRKAAVDAKRSNLFTKISKLISIAARNGSDPEMNFSLRLAMDKARQANMPKDNIEKAVKRGAGELGGAALEEVMYEGYGPSGIPLLIEGVTDNKNRTTPEVKAILTKNGGSLGAQNSVKWMFGHKGVIRIELAADQDTDELMLEIIDLGADDVLEEEGGLTVYAGFKNFEKVKKDLETKQLKIDCAEMEWVAKDRQNMDESVQDKVARIIDLLEEHDDVNSVYTNLK
jgi:YebC/PmpR family DNA-binding regulatory protein